MLHTEAFCDDWFLDNTSEVQPSIIVSIILAEILIFFSLKVNVNEEINDFAIFTNNVIKGSRIVYVTDLMFLFFILVKFSSFIIGKARSGLTSIWSLLLLFGPAFSMLHVQKRFLKVTCKPYTILFIVSKSFHLLMDCHINFDLRIYYFFLNLILFLQSTEDGRQKTRTIYFCYLLKNIV